MMATPLLLRDSCPVSTWSYLSAQKVGKEERMDIGGKASVFTPMVSPTSKNMTLD